MKPDFMFSQSDNPIELARAYLPGDLEALAEDIDVKRHSFFVGFLRVRPPRVVGLASGEPSVPQTGSNPGDPAKPAFSGGRFGSPRRIGGVPRRGRRSRIRHQRRGLTRRPGESLRGTRIVQP